MLSCWEILRFNDFRCGYPQKSGVPQALQSARLVDDLCNSDNEYIRPKLVIGLTADVRELGAYRENFYRIASVVLPAHLNSQD